jgi:hypothetical protein
MVGEGSGLADTDDPASDPALEPAGPTALPNAELVD